MIKKIYFSVESPTKSVNISPEKYLKLDMKGKIIHSINLPPLSSDYIFQSYKVKYRYKYEIKFIKKKITTFSK